MTETVLGIVIVPVNDVFIKFIQEEAIFTFVNDLVIPVIL